MPKLAEYESKIQELQDENRNLSQEIAILKNMVKKSSYILNLMQCISTVVLTQHRGLFQLQLVIILIIFVQILHAVQESVELRTDAHNRSDYPVSYPLNGSLSNGHISSGSRNSQTLFPNGRLKSLRPSSMCDTSSLRYDVSKVAI